MAVVDINIGTGSAEKTGTKLIQQVNCRARWAASDVCQESADVSGFADEKLGCSTASLSVQMQSIYIV